MRRCRRRADKTVFSATRGVYRPILFRTERFELSNPELPKPAARAKRPDKSNEKSACRLLSEIFKMRRPAAENLPHFRISAFLFFNSSNRAK
jgi:hypothetical protein